jgi:hypothetical protein
VAGGLSPHSGGTVPDLHRVPFPLAGLRAERIIARMAARAASFQARWLPAIAWATMIFALSGIPSLGTGLGAWDLVLRKIAHALVYAVLGLLLVRAFERALPAFAAGVAYAVVDELHQGLVPGRHAAPLDVLIDCTGLAIGIVAAARIRR